MTGERVGIGFIGCGLIARSHARGLAAVEGAEVVAVHDVDGARAHAFALDVAGSSAAVVGSAEAVIAAADAVYVCTWTADHAEAVAAVAAAGKPVFCEKPLAVDLATATAMTDAVTGAGVVNQVGLVLRHSPAFRLLHHAVTTDATGSLLSIVFRDDQYLPTQGMYDSTWRADRTKAGAGTLLEHSIHDLDLLRWMMGPIRAVSARSRADHGLDGIDDQTSVLLEATSGAQAVLVSVWHDVLSRPSQRRVEVFCRDSVLTLAGDWLGPVTIEAAGGGGWPGGLGTTVEGAALDRMAADVDGMGTNPDADFVDAVRAGRAAHPDFAVALEAHRLVDAAYASAADDGRPVTIAAL